MSLNKFPSLVFVSSVKNDGNMSFKRGNPKNALKNRRRFLKSLGLKLDSIVCMAPYHSKKIVKAAKKDLGKGSDSLSKKIHTDGLITKDKGVYLFVTTGDCLPVAFFDIKSEAVALIHAGWKGLDKGIINNVVMYFKNKFGTDLNNLYVQIGPSIGPCCYIKKNPPSQIKNSSWKKFITNKDGSYSIDLWGFAQNQLEKLKIPKENIYNPEKCTYHPGEYFSHQRFTDKNLQQDSRFATILGLNYAS